MLVFSLVGKCLGYTKRGSGHGNLNNFVNTLLYSIYLISGWERPMLKEVGQYQGGHVNLNSCVSTLLYSLHLLSGWERPGPEETGQY